ncbi:hypothetical protein [Helicobacter sp. MIT 99-5507]|uniref:hypothetical protein n=1 Tax=Helicobacter sp. MIT 99-5507 TaxID=152489 RepID=UPI000E1F8416|nr:hypothetical protein [Helicobacter sp. MIT 99-5507]RDU57452.1 hypothetical protein CQA42_05885 [Helicobacter sp. MIT 99-5507]
MKIFIYFLVAIIIGVALYFIIKDNFTKRNKVIVSILIVILLITIGIYTTIQDNNNKKDIELISAFMRGETIKCGDIDINSDKFNFTNPTLSFIGKKDTEFYGKIIFIKQCY